MALSTRVTPELHLALCEQARAENSTPSSFLYRLLAQALSKTGRSLEGGHEKEDLIPAHSMALRLENVERWVELLFLVILTAHRDWFEDLSCPGCTRGSLAYFETPSEQQDGNSRSGFACQGCGWAVEF
jgi:hypothetical protein